MKQKKAIKIYKTLTFLVLLLMVTATILGGVFVNNIQAKNANPDTISMYKLKKKYAFPEWTSLPLILNIVFGFIATHTGNREVLNIKIAFDVFEIIIRILMIVILAGFVIPPYVDCLTSKMSRFNTDMSPSSMVNSINSTTIITKTTTISSPDSLFKVDCFPSNIERDRLELDLLLVLVIVELLLLVVLSISVFVFLLDFKRNCCCYEEDDCNSWYFDRAGTGVIDKRMIRYNPVPLKDFGTSDTPPRKDLNSESNE